MNNKIQISEDGYILQKIVLKDTIKRIIDWKKFNITKEMIRDHISSTEKTTYPNIDTIDINQMDLYHVMNMCSPYSMPDDKDTFVYYNDIGVLSGTAGYIRIRDGYVYDRRIVWRS